MTARVDPSSLLTGTAERPALAFGDGSLSYAELRRAAGGLATELEALAPRRSLEGAPIAVVAPNAPAIVAAMLALWEVGAVAVPLSARLREYELERILRDVDPAAIVSPAAHGGYSFDSLWSRLGPELPALRGCLLVDEWGGVLERVPARPEADVSSLDSDAAAILYTSGSTGAPKGAVVTHGCLLQEARVLGELLGLTEGEGTALVIPASHAFGLACLLASLGSQGHVVLMDTALSLDPLLEAMATTGASVVHGSPTVFARLLEACPNGIPGLRTGFVGGATCPPQLIERLEAAEATILNLYGMTEIGAAACCRPDDPAEARRSTAGAPLPGYEFRSVASRGDDGRPGELQVRGPHVTTGYRGAPQATADAFDGEWFRTGDLGEIDAAGRLRILGRAKEMLNVGGFNVFPAEVEAFLETHPDVLAAAVVGIPHERMGEAPCAFVVARPGATLTPQEIRRFARAGIAGYKIPYAVDIVSELPTLSSGKPDREALRERAAKRGLVHA
jgi:acyl-CoA synthetase (AMP-forming)/AMP-acid ligase II